MKIDDIKKLIPLYLDGLLEGEELRAVEDFVKNHPEGSRILSEYSRTWDLLGQIGDIDPEPAYVSSFWTKLSKLRPRGNLRFWESAQSWLASRKLAASWAALASVMVIWVLTFGHLTLNNRSDIRISDMDPIEIELMDKLDLVQNYEIIINLDLLEELEWNDNLSFDHEFNPVAGGVRRTNVS